MRALATIVLFSAPVLAAQDKNPLEPLHFLLGTWTADSENQLGTSHGATTFKLDLDKHVMVRTNFAEYTRGSLAGTRHDDLMIIYADRQTPRAIFFDSEGHTIRYTVTIPAPDSVVFESESGEPGPRYRLTNSVRGNLFDGKFEIAEPGKSDYKTYLTWRSTKSK